MTREDVLSDAKFDVNERWRSIAHRHFGVRQTKRGFRPSMVPVENDDIRAWLVNMTSERSSWATPYMKEPFRSWTMHKVKMDENGERIQPSLWVLCEKGNAETTFAFVRAKILPLMNDVVSALVKEGVAPAATFCGSEVIFVAIKKPLRTLPERHGQPVNPEHINGGLTHHVIAGPSPSRVLVYRVQDAGKVLVHELLHLAGLDAALQPTPGWGSVGDAQDKIVKRYRVQARSRPLGLNESYTEVLACYLHTLWWAAKESDASFRRSLESTPLTHKEKTNEHARRWSSYSPKAVSSHRIRIENEALEKMAAHIQTIARRIWRHFYHDRGHDRFVMNVDWKEGTHCFSYVACRAALWSPPFLMRFLGSYPPGASPQDPGAYARLLIEALDEWIAKNKNFVVKLNLNVRSLKMTCFT